MTVDTFLSAIMRYCFFTGGSVTSFGRTPKHNKQLKGKRFSPHQAWLGADVVYDAPPDQARVTITAMKELSAY